VPCGLVCVRHNDIINGLHCKEKSSGKGKKIRGREGDRASSLLPSSVPVLLLRAPLLRGLPILDSSTECPISLFFPALRRNPRRAPFQTARGYFTQVRFLLLLLITSSTQCQFVFCSGAVLRLTLLIPTNPILAPRIARSCPSCWRRRHTSPKYCFAISMKMGMWKRDLGRDCRVVCCEAEPSLILQGIG
jgi:hypothetical protein